MAVLESGHLTQGAVVEEFEARFAAWCGVKHAIAVSSGTAALHVSVLARGIGPGDEVITTPFSFIASANAALFVGARPVFVDIDPVTFCLDPDLVEAAVTPRTKAILPVHLYGHPAPMRELGEIAGRHGLDVIEDASQAHGAVCGGAMVGGLGSCAVFSLYPTKNMTSGEGGFVTTDDESTAERARALRSHGSTRRYHHTTLGYNYRLSDLHAAVGLAQLARVDAFNGARRRNAAVLTAGLADVPGVRVPTEAPGCSHVFHQYTLRVANGRDSLRGGLEALGVGTEVYYPTPIHKQPLYESLGYGSQRLVEAERASREVLSLPVHPGVGDEQLRVVVDSIRALVAGS
jgi:dTDP-4-amino-4,6-dideoxygalactose transaminase